MLYIFHVDTGAMMTFEMNLALESVAHLKEVIERACRIPPEKQVLLVSGGESLEPTARVCSYSAGTDTNPIFLFSKCSIESISPPLPSIDYGSDMDLKEQVDASLSMPASYNTVVVRAQLAQQFCELARDQTRICERLVHDQHLQQQGWAAVVANLEDSVSAFRARGEAFVQSYQQHLESRSQYMNFLENFNNVLGTLSKIPVLPALLANATEFMEGQDMKSKESHTTEVMDGQEVKSKESHANSNGSKSVDQTQPTMQENSASAMSTAPGGDGTESMTVSKKSNSSRSGSGDEWQKRHEEKAVTLLQWISTKDNQSSLEHMVEQCARGLEQFDERVLDSLRRDVKSALDAANKVDMKEIKGLEERLFGLEQLMFESKRIVQEQSDLATAFHQNQTRANNLGDASILPDLCATHRRQLLLMLQNHHQLRDIRRRCNRAKEELSINLYHRLRWIMYVENLMCDVAGKLMIYHENLKRLRRHLEVVRQVQMAPSMYVTAVSEVVRRRTFSQAFLVWAGDLSAQLQAVHSEEVTRRREFQARFEGHFLNTLFPGMEDCPPPFATQPPPPFDAALPKLSKDDVERLKTGLPDLALSLSTPDLGHLAELLFNKSVTGTLKSDGKQNVALEDCLVEAVTAAGLGSTLDPTLLQPADTTHISPSSLPLRDDRGFESETDTEEFEKVGQSPVELDQTSVQAPTSEDNLGNAQLQAEQARLHLSTMGRMALAATERLHAELGQMRGQVEVERDVFVKLIDTFRLAWEQLLSAANAANSASRALDIEVELERERRTITAKDDIIRTLTQSVEERTATVEQLEASLRQRLKVEEEQRAQAEQLQRHFDETVQTSDQSDQERCAELERRLVELEKDRERCEELQKRLDHITAGGLEDLKKSLDEQKASLDLAHALDLQTLKAEMEAERNRALKELSDKLAREHHSQLEGLRSRFRLVACTSMERSPSDSSLEKIEGVRGHRQELDAETKEAVVRETEQRVQNEWEVKLQQELRNSRLKLEAERQVWFNDAMRRVVGEKERQIDLLTAREAALKEECQKHQETIRRLTDDVGSAPRSLDAHTNLFTLLDRVDHLEAELATARSQLASMGTSVAVVPIEGVSSRDAATSPEPHSLKKNLTCSAKSLLQQGRISIGSCTPGDIVLAVWDDAHQNYVILQESSTFYFVHSDCLEALGLSLQSDVGKRKMVSPAEVLDKDYCHAKKAENRFNVPKGTKFYRVKVRPLQDDNLMSKSSHRHKERQQQMLQQLQHQQQYSSLQQPLLSQQHQLHHQMGEQSNKGEGDIANETEAVSLPCATSGPLHHSSVSSLPDMPGTEASQ